MLVGLWHKTKFVVISHSDTASTDSDEIHVSKHHSYFGDQNGVVNGKFSDRGRLWSCKGRCHEGL